MKYLIFFLAIIFNLTTLKIIAQNNGTFEIEAVSVESIDNQDVKLFYNKFNEFLQLKQKDGEQIDINMINNFIIFSEDGLIMKDLEFHSVESCKKEIKSDQDLLNIEPDGKSWIYVSLESHVNEQELENILNFLRQNKIQYKFGHEDKFVPLITKN